MIRHWTTHRPII